MGRSIGDEHDHLARSRPPVEIEGLPQTGRDCLGAVSTATSIQSLEVLVYLIDIGSETKVFGDVGVVLGRMVSKRDEAHTQVFLGREAAVGDDISTDALDMLGRVGDIRALGARGVLDKHKVSAAVSACIQSTDNLQHLALWKRRLDVHGVWCGGQVCPRRVKGPYLKARAAKLDPHPTMNQHDAVQAVLDTILEHTPHSLEAQHALLQAIISALCLQLVRVQAALSARAPISRLSDDVLTQIFTYAVHPSSVYASTTPTATSIAGTNRRWRTLALGHPALWTRVDLRHPSAPYALVYSRRLGLEVRLDAPLWKDARDAPLARTLAPHVARVRQLWIQTASVHTESFLKSISKCQLERLVVTGRYTDDHPLELSPSLLPRLRHLSLTHAFLAPSPVPTNLLSLSLKPPPGAPPLALSALADLLKASPNLTDLALFGHAVPVYKPGEPQHERTDLVKLKTLKVAGVNPVQAAWLLFHLSHPSGTLLTLDLEPSRPLRTIAFDRPRAPDFTRPRAPGELESYYAVLTMFRSGAIPLDTISIGPALSENKQQQVVESKPSEEEEIITEKLAAHYTSALSTLSLAAGSRATEALARLLAAPVPSITKLVITSVKLGLERLDEIKRQDEACQIRTLEIRACSLPVVPKAERRNEVRIKGGPPPTPSQTSPTSGPNPSPPTSSANLAVPSNGFTNPYSSTGFPSSSSSPTPTHPPIPTPGPQPNLPIWTPYTASHELVTPTSAGAFMPFYAGGAHVNGTGSNGDTLNSPASSEDDTVTTDTAVPDQGLDTNLSSSVHSASGDTTLASIASSEDANHTLDEEEPTPDHDDETSSEISDTDAVVNLNASETVDERRKNSLPTRSTRPTKLRDEIVAKLRDDVIGKLRDDIMGKLQGDKARVGAREEGSDKVAASTAGTVGTPSASASGTSTPVLATPAQNGTVVDGANGVNGTNANGTTGTDNANGSTGTNGINGQVNGSKPPLPSTTSAPLLSTTNLPPANPPQPPLNRVATAPQLDQLKLKSNFLRPSHSSSNLRRPLGFAPYATSVAVTGFTTESAPAKPAPCRSPTFPFPNQPSFHTLQHPDDPDIRLLTVLSFHMPQLEELRIVRSTIRGNALIKFIESRNNSVDDESDSDSEGGRAGPGTPILMLELVECPYVSAEHVRVLRESVDDVRWKAYTYVGGAV
ncbi:hypothetical protein ACGC1H_004618 [Rhizoctonia solani]